jgi:ribose/xylose/arabinose/galactoside ABC-type transport system permease subunit
VASLAAAMVLLGISAAIEYRMQVRGDYLTLAEEALLPSFRYAWPWAAGLVLAAEIWRHSLPGIRHVAVGMDRQAAILAAIPLDRVQRRAFLCSSLLSCLACLLFITGFQRGGWDAEAGKGIELVAIAVAVIGGTRVSGGVFRPIGAFLGIILWESLDHLRFLADIGIAYQELVGGFLLLGVVAVSGARLRSKPQQQAAVR